MIVAHDARRHGGNLAWPWIFLTLLGMSLPACDVEFTDQEISIRHERGVDSADLLLVYHDLEPGDDLDAATERVARMLDGRAEAPAHPGAVVEVDPLPVDEDAQRAAPAAGE